MITHQTPEQILQAATPEQKILWNYIFLRFGERVAISQHYYQGLTTGMGELGVYSVNKLYIAYEFEAGDNTGIIAAANAVYFFDENNAGFKQYAPLLIAWDATAAAIRYLTSNYLDKNFYFSRLTASNYEYIKFNGFRLGI